MAALAGGAGLAVLPSTAAVAQATPTTNACYNSATAAIAPATADFNATVPSSVAPGANVPVTNLSSTITMPGAVFVTGYNPGLVPDGGNVAGTVSARLRATNTVEGEKATNAVPASIGPIDISDPDGTPGTGDETAPDQIFTVNFADMAYTAGASGPIVLREASVPITNAAGSGGLSIDAQLGFTVKFRCSPGTVEVVPPNNTATFGTAPAISTTNVVVPAAAPVAANDSASVGANPGGFRQRDRQRHRRQRRPRRRLGGHRVRPLGRNRGRQPRRHRHLHQHLGRPDRLVHLHRRRRRRTGEQRGHGQHLHPR
ncbi:hypothetical protein LP418_12780 [Nocardioides sp. B-3]|nr:hypothetical protein [Nocardioides sp. B-3]UUZ61367.1 hypothetical protein LP418_12780 [Nocardioides sp. B-3]